MYYRYLARLVLLEKGKKNKERSEDETDFSWAIRKFYFSAKKMFLRDTYDHMLASRYMTPEGRLMETAPSWYSFEHYYYRHGYNKSIKCMVPRGELSNYQRNERTLFGSTMTWKDKAGAFQMDATEADIYLVSHFDRSMVVGRPNIYMAVDTATQLIAGIYIGLEQQETEAQVAVIKSIQAIVDAVDGPVGPEGKTKQKGADIRLNRADERIRLT